MKTGTPGVARAREKDERWERDALRSRICILEAALASIARETNLASRVPEVSFLVIRRIAAITRQTVGEVEEPADVRRA